jgi:hypothetical protein
MSVKRSFAMMMAIVIAVVVIGSTISQSQFTPAAEAQSFTFAVPRDQFWCGEDLFYVTQQAEITEDRPGLPMYHFVEKESNLVQYGTNEILFRGVISAQPRCYQDAIVFLNQISPENAKITKYDLATDQLSQIRGYTSFAQYFSVSQQGNAAIVASSGHLSILNLETGKEVSNSQIGLVDAVSSPSWSPDGNHITLTHYYGGMDGPTWAVLIIDLANQSIQTLSEMAENPQFNPYADHNQLAYLKNGELYVVSLDVPETHRQVGPASYINGRYNWSPDSLLVYSHAITEPLTQASGGVRVVGIEICTAETDGSYFCYPDSMGSNPVWSLDGKQIAYLVYELDQAFVKIIDR